MCIRDSVYVAHNIRRRYGARVSVIGHAAPTGVSAVGVERGLRSLGRVVARSRPRRSVNTSRVELIDDRLLVERLLGGDPVSNAQIATTPLWYFRACRASVLGAGGQLSGPFARLDDEHQGAAITRLLELDDDVELPDPRNTVPVMAQVAQRHPQLNLLNLEATAAALVLEATVVLSAKAATGILPGVLGKERIPWRIFNSSQSPT